MTLSKRLATGLAAVAGLALLLTALSCARPPQPAPAPSPATATAPVPPASPDPHQLYLPRVDRDQAPTSAAPPVAEASPISEPTPTPASTPTPRPMDLADWPPLRLADWPRPAEDNGLCIHNIPDAYFDEATVDLQISRLKAMRMTWTVVLYGDELHLAKAAPRYRDAGITVIWRKWLWADEPYYGWGRDVALLRELGVAPYMQIYNEPDLPAEWRGAAPDQALFLEHFISAVEQVYNAGGYVGLQFVSDQWLAAALREIQRRGGERVFGRTFLVPHPYGLNHPPDYTEDANGVLGWRQQAEVARAILGFTPPLIAGEGGWKWNAGDDSRFPRIDAALHRDYHLAVFNWFRTGVLSDGQPLPDYLFAFCPWLLSAKGDDSAWFDSFAGDHIETIEAVKALPPFRRTFSGGGLAPAGGP